MKALLSTLGASVCHVYDDMYAYANATKGSFCNAKKQNPDRLKRTFFNYRFNGECLRCMIVKTQTKGEPNCGVL